MEHRGIPFRLARGTEASATATPDGVEHRQILYGVLVRPSGNRPKPRRRQRWLPRPHPARARPRASRGEGPAPAAPAGSTAPGLETPRAYAHTPGPGPAAPGDATTELATPRLARAGRRYRRGRSVLQTRAMTASAKGTVESPGRNVRQKAGLNRVILATGWSGLRAMLAYKAPRLLTVDPRYTSQTCAACGEIHAASRQSQANFHCVACGHADHADLNAALHKNIRRRGLALRHGEECSASPTPVTRETDRRLAA